ncbi:unnamed protein product [Lactuca virosa]|uniref:EF-hand domain-containing protein n=1 Tax=Lactuca virosa TaxID=75947 RepID=A0AAU9PL43_9ASTR|nr:unnamed protein product [Lactuca virosa]
MKGRDRMNKTRSSKQQGWLGRFHFLIHQQQQTLVLLEFQLPSYFRSIHITLTMGGKLTKGDESPMTSAPTTKLEAKILKTMRSRESQGTSMKSFNTIILKFPKIDASLRKCKAIFEQFDEDKSGSIDPKELNHCFRELKIDFTDEEIKDIFEECDINDDMGINFKEFIVILCLVYLLKKDRSNSRMGIPDLETAFETMVDSFVFLDKNKDGYVSKDEMVGAINETTSGERSSGRIAMRRFEEMDWDKNGMVNFKEFLFAFTKWIGLEDAEDEDEEEEEDINE